MTDTDITDRVEVRAEDGSRLTFTRDERGTVSLSVGQCPDRSVSVRLPGAEWERVRAWGGGGPAVTDEPGSDHCLHLVPLAEHCPKCAADPVTKALEHAHAAPAIAACGWHRPPGVCTCPVWDVVERLKNAGLLGSGETARAVATELRWFALHMHPVVGQYAGGNSANVNRWNDARRLEVRAEQLDPGGPWPDVNDAAPAVPAGPGDTVPRAPVQAPTDEPRGDAWVTSVDQVRGALDWLLYVAEHGDDETGQDEAAREAIGAENYARLHRLLGVSARAGTAPTGEPPYSRGWRVGDQVRVKATGERGEVDAALGDGVNVRIPQENAPSHVVHLAATDLEPDRTAPTGEPGVTETVPRDLLESFVDGDDCSLDHHGGCQAHGYISLRPGELCPQAELKQLLNWSSS